MKRFTILTPFYAFLLLSLSSCFKIDWNEIFPSVNPAKNCEVQELRSALLGSITSYPYVFRKTFDASGLTIKEIDSYVYGAIAPYSIHAKLKYQGPSIYLIDAINERDTLMVILLNSQGKPVKANEYAAFYKNSLVPSTPPVQLEFTYSQGRLFSTKTTTFAPFSNSFSDTCRYDPQGNIVFFKFSNYEYDYSRKAAAQYYVDTEQYAQYASYSHGLSVILYLDLLPEITSPINVRTKRSIGSYEFVLANHQFDDKGKLLSYDVKWRSSIDKTTLLWKCTKSK